MLKIQLFALLMMGGALCDLVNFVEYEFTAEVFFKNLAFMGPCIVRIF